LEIDIMAYTVHIHRNGRLVWVQHQKFEDDATAAAFADQMNEIARGLDHVGEVWSVCRESNTPAPWRRTA